MFWRERKAQTNWIWSVWEPLLFEVKSVPRVSQRREEKKGEGWRGSAQKFRFFNSVSQNYPGLSFFFPVLEALCSLLGTKSIPQLVQSNALNT